MTVPQPMHVYLVSLAMAQSDVPDVTAAPFTVEEWCAVIGLVVSAGCALARMVWLWRQDKRASARRRRR